MKREVVFQHYEDRILIRYTLVDAIQYHIKISTILAFRSVRQFTMRILLPAETINLLDNGIKTCMYTGYPELFIQFSKENRVIFKPWWYRGVEYLGAGA